MQHSKNFGHDLLPNRTALLIQRMHCTENWGPKRRLIQTLQEIFHSVWFVDLKNCPSGSIPGIPKEYVIPSAPRAHGPNVQFWFIVDYVLPEIRNVGVLTMHADAFVSPLLFKNANKDCTLSTEFDIRPSPPKAAWGWHWPRQGKLVNDTMRNYNFIKDNVSNGWVDIYYIPPGLVKSYNRYAVAFRNVGVMNEVAVATIINWLEGCKENIKCAGGAEKKVDEVDFGRVACGHKVNLRDSKVVSRLYDHYSRGFHVSTR